MSAAGRVTARLAAVALGLLALAAGPASGQETPEELLRAYVEVWNTGELGRLDDLVTADFRRHGGFGPAGSRRELAGVIANSRRFYRGLRIEVYHVLANPEKGAMRWRFTGGWGDTRFLLDSLNFAMYRFAGGRIAEEWVLGNNMDLFRTFGYRLTPPGDRIVPPPVEAPPGPPLAERLATRAADLAAAADDARRAAPANAGELVVRSEVACRLFLDGRPIGALVPGGSVALRLAPGTHGVRAASLGGSVFFERDVKVRKRGAATVEVESPGRVIVHPRRRTAEDLATGLMWQTSDDGVNATLAAARAACAALDQGGYDDWRLPTIHELVTLHAPDSARRYRTLPGVQLSDCCPWSSTPHGDFYWTFAFAMDMRYLQREDLGYHMRTLCVRDAAADG